MTEEDTFKKLKKLTFEEMSRVYSQAYNKNFPRGLKEVEALCKKYGWTYDEFLDTIEKNNYRKIYDRK